MTRPLQTVLWFLVSGLIASGQITVDFAKPSGTIKPLHGVNGGPFEVGENARLGDYHAEAGFPHTRLHDVRWPSPNAVDISCVFPLFRADPDDPRNYTFARTDDYIAAIVRNKSQVIYRLGESIEPWTRYHNGPPPDAAKWARICVNIIRHYNEGWANGFHHGIRYWEIWNEPEAGFMWTGTRDQYFALYETAARAIKAHDPALKVGGPAHNNINSEWARPFLALCREKSLPLDFFSWHAYYGQPASLAADATTARRLLDEFGFKNTESHLNEWRYLTTWDGLRPGNPAEYRNVPEWFARSCRAEGAAFCVSVLLTMQDQPVDVMNFYAADTSAWSLFGQFGIPSKAYYAFKAFNELARNNRRITCVGPNRPDLHYAASLSQDGKSAVLLVSKFKGERLQLPVRLENLPRSGPVKVRTFLISDTCELVQQDDRTVKDEFELSLEANTVWLIRIDLAPLP